MDIPEIDDADPFSLTASVGRSGANDRADVIKAQTLLANAGYLDLPSPGIPTGWASADLFSGISRLQKDNGLDADGLLLPLPRDGVGPNGEGETLAQLKQTIGPRFDGAAALTPEEVDRFHALNGQDDEQARAAAAGIVTRTEQTRSGAPAGTRPARAAKRTAAASPEQNRAVVADLLDDPRVQAFLDTIANLESRGRYDILNGGQRFDSYARHPNADAGNKAAGAYQFKPGTWAEVAMALGLQDFTPASQDQGAVRLLSKPSNTEPKEDALSAIGRLQRGDIEGAIFAAGKHWDAFPKDASGKSLNGYTRELQPIIDQYKRRLKALQ